MDMPTIHPHALNPGDTIGIVAPAGPLEQIAALEQGVATLERLGFRVRYTDRIFHSRHEKMPRVQMNCTATSKTHPFKRSCRSAAAMVARA
jgi:hypothetical protein